MIAQLPWLSLLLALPCLGVAAIWLWPRPAAARQIALGATMAALLLSLAIVAVFDPAMPGFQLTEKHAWIPGLGIDYFLGIDGIALLFLPATCLLFVGTILASWNAVQVLGRLYYSLLLLLASATLGVFCALDNILFFLFWELTLIPLYFLVSLWGVGPDRRHAAVKYLLVMLAGGVALLFGFLVLAFGAATDGTPVFSLPVLLATPLPPGSQYLVFALLLIGFGMKVPLFPFHTWLPLIAMEGPVAVLALITGLKVGIFGLIRFAVPLAPTAAQELHWLLAGLGTATLLFAAVAALAQTNLRRMLGYASISHAGLVVLGIASYNQQGIQGAVMQLLNLAIAGGGLFLLASHLHQRTGSTDVASLGGAARTMPLLASFFLLFGLAGMGLPGTSGFPAELLILLSTFEAHAGAGLAALAAMVLGAAYFLKAYRGAFFGPARHGVVLQAHDLLPRELGFALVLAALVLLFGFLPGLVLDLISPATAGWVASLG